MNVSMTRRAWLAPVLAGLLLLAGCAGRGPEAVVSRFYHAVAAGDIGTAAALIHVDETDNDDAIRAQTHTYLALVSIQAEITLAGGLDAIEIDKVDVPDDARRTVHITLHFGNGRTQTDTTTLIKTDTGWMIAG